MDYTAALQRFIDAQQDSYATALAEVRRGRKQTHWMWFIFPQIQGLGFSATARHYAIKDLNEATAYLQHPVLGSRLLEITNVLLQLPASDVTQVFGYPDDLKLHSSMTLFAAVPNADPVFEAILNKYFSGRRDEKTIAMLQQPG